MPGKLNSISHTSHLRLPARRCMQMALSSRAVASPTYSCCVTLYSVVLLLHRALKKKDHSCYARSQHRGTT